MAVEWQKKQTLLDYRIHMFTLVDLLAQLKARNIKIWQDNGDLCLDLNGGDLPEALKEQILSKKPVLLEYLQSLNEEKDAAITRIANDNDIDIFPLSYGQERLWFLNEYESESNRQAYNEPIVIRVRGDLNIPRLKEAIHKMIVKHKSFQTVFFNDNGVPKQKVIKEPSFDFSYVEEPKGEIQDLILAELNYSFDLENGPLLKVTIIRESENSCILVMNRHHITMDAWSDTLIFQDIAHYYNHGSVKGSASVLRYVDYATWQRNRINGSVGVDLVSYWKAKLSDVNPVLSLPYELPRSAEAARSGKRLTLKLDPAVSASVNNFCKKNNITPYIAFLSCFSVLLYKHTRSKDFLIGSFVANRSHPQTKDLVGFFTNTLPIRIQTIEESTFIEHSLSVRETFLDAFEHQELPFDKIVDALNVARSSNTNPLVQIAFNLVDTPADSFELKDISLEEINVSEVKTKFDLMLTIISKASDFSLVIEYTEELFKETDIQKIYSDFEEILKSAFSPKTSLISNLFELSPQERNTLINEWNDTAVDYPLHLCVHELFEEQALKTPERIAVQFEEKFITYAELDARANKLANYLVSKEVKAGTLVGVYMDRSLELVVALLGILKCGAAYAPIDPSYPEDRRAYILEASAAPVLLTQEHLLETAPSGNCTTICLDTDWPQISENSSQKFDIKYNSDDLICVLFTSGSTGKPKGVMCVHRGMTNRILWMQDAYGLKEDDVVLQKTPIGFDVSGWEFYWPLIIGAKLVMARPEGHKDPNYLIEVINNQAVTTLHFVPPMLQAFVSTEGFGSCQSIRRIICSGDILHMETQRKVFKYLGCEVHNLYGPTEASIDVTAWQCTPDYKGASIPIGKPIANTQMYVLDDKMMPMPIGVPGELYIGGVQLARGYLNRPDLTDDRFVLSPFDTTQSGRLYKTGDLARYLSDGNIEFLGRLDFQVKIRGVRIELGEIETVLDMHPDIKECVVVAREDTPGEKYLVAYIATNSEAPLAPKELREYLGKALSEAMIPAHFVNLDAMPLSPNGKIDRQKLPAPEYVRTQSAAEYVAPRNNIEEKLAKIWAEVLRLDKVGVNENFFEIGGDSILSISIVSKARAENVKITVKNIFQYQTIADLSTVAQSEKNGSQKGTIQNTDLSNRSYPLSPMQEGMLFHTLHEDNDVYLQQVCFYFNDRIDETVAKEAWEKLIERHAILRTTFDWEASDNIIQTVHDSFDLNFKVIRDIEEVDCKSGAVKNILSQDRQEKFDLKNGPLMRIKLLQSQENKSCMVWSHHHILLDGWSVAIIVDEFFRYYEAIRDDKSSSLPHLKPYRNYIDWLRNIDVAEDKIYWGKYLSGINNGTEIKLEKNDGVFASEMASHKFSLSEEDTQSIKSFARKNKLTLNTVIQGAWSIVLSRYSGGSNDVVFGNTISGRPESLDGSEGMVGLFINTIPVRIKIDHQDGISNWLKEIQENQSNSWPHQYAPLAKIKSWSSISHEQELFDTLLVFENYKDNDWVNEKKNALTHVDFIENDNHPLTLICNPSSNIEFEIRTKFPSWPVESIKSLLIETIKDLSDERNAYLKDMPSLPEHEKEIILNDWNATTVEYPLDTCIHQLFEEQALKTPDRPAVVFEGEILTYAELDSKANKLANYLTAEGVGPGKLVSVYMDRSLELVIAFLGILKSGAAYVPIDPSYPDDRRNYILEASAAPVLLTQEHLFENAPSGDCKIVCLDKDWHHISERISRKPDITHDAGSLVCVLFTSGSTGKPKGVMCVHRGMTNRVLWMQDAYNLQQSDVILQKTPIGFDVSGWEFYWPLITGAKLVMARPEGHKDPSYLVEVINEQEVTTLHFVPPMLQAFVSTEGFETCKSIKRIICSGDILHFETQRRVFECLDCEIHNLYGPTEASIDVTAWQCTPNYKGASIPIGKSIANTQMHILDDKRNMLPIGVPGELYIGGVQLALGYLNRTDLTDERFVLNPFDETKSSRFYKTGDLARYLPDGNIEFLGRLDFQVKIRGVRIELGEIETVLDKHPNIKESVVVAREDIPGTKYLVAYIVAKADDISIKELRDYLGKSLSEAMIPGHFVYMESMPLSPNGKIDRQKLPVPGSSREDSSKLYVAPGNEIEETLANIWAEILRLDKVGIYDNFFEIGGDSILSISIVSKARASGLKISTKDIFSKQTIAELASNLSFDSVSSIKGVPAFGDSKLTPIQQWFFDLDLSNPNHWNQSIILRLDQKVDIQALNKSFSTILQHHDALRSQFIMQGDVWKAYIPEHANEFSVHEYSKLGSSEEDIFLSIEDEINTHHRSINIQDGNLLKALVFYKDNESFIVIIAHHLAMDMVSWRILVEDLQAVYTAEISNRPINLHKKTTAYRAWADALHGYADNLSLDHIIIEDKKLKVDKPFTFLPGGEDISAKNTEVENTTLTFAFDRDETSILLNGLYKRHRIRPQELLVCGLSYAVSKWAERSRRDAKSIFINMESHGRDIDFFDHVDLSRTVGWFTAIYPVQIDLDFKNSDFIAKINDVKDAIANSLENSVLYGIKKYIQGDYNEPTAEILFNYLGDLKIGEKSGLFDLYQWSTTQERDLSNRRTHLIEINSFTDSGELKVEIAFSKKLHSPIEIERLSSDLRDFVEKSAEIQESEISYPLTPMQKEMYRQFVRQRNRVHILQHVFSIKGKIDAKVLKQACNDMLDSHEGLRCRFHEDKNGNIGQSVSEIILDWEEIRPEENFSADYSDFIQSIQEADLSLGFDISTGSLIRFKLIEFSNTDHALLISMHHIIIDGWSIPIILDEIVGRYHSISRNSLFNDKKERSFLDLTKKIVAQDSSAEEFWRGRFLSVSEGCLFSQWNHLLGTHQKRTTLLLDSYETSLLKNAARAYKVTLNVLMQGAWALVLSMYHKNKKDIVFGSMMSGRSETLKGVEDMVGMFINALPIHVSLNPETNVKDWFQGIQAGQARILQYQHTSLDDIRKWNSLSRDARLFDTMIIFQNFKGHEKANMSLNGVNDNASISWDSYFEERDALLALEVELSEKIIINLLHPIALDNDFVESFLHSLREILDFLMKEPTENLQDILMKKHNEAA